MRKSFAFRAVFCLAAAALGAGCQPFRYDPPKVTAPDLPVIPRFDGFSGPPFLNPENGRLISCDRAEIEQPAPQADLEIETEVSFVAKMQNVRRIACGGEPVDEEVRRMNTPRALVATVDPQAPLTGVSFALVRNERTCLEARLDATDDAPDVAPSDVRDFPAFEGAPIPLPKFGSLRRNGRLQFVAELSIMSVLGTGVPVLEGANSIVVTYYGACVRNAPNRRAGQRDAEGCAEAPVLRRVHVKLNARVSTERLEGTYLRRSCSGRGR